MKLPEVLLLRDRESLLPKRLLERRGKPGGGMLECVVDDGCWSAEALAEEDFVQTAKEFDLAPISQSSCILALVNQTTTSKIVGGSLPRKQDGYERTQDFPHGRVRLSSSSQQPASRKSVYRYRMRQWNWSSGGFASGSEWCIACLDREGLDLNRCQALSDSLLFI